MEPLALISLIGILLFAGGIWSITTRPEAKRLQERLLEPAAPKDEANEARTSLIDDERTLLVRLLSFFAGKSERKSTSSSVQTRLTEAGYRRESAVAAYTGGRIALTLLLAAVGLLFSQLQQLTGIYQQLGSVALGGAVGFIAPGYWVDVRRKRRQRELRNRLPDALDLLIVCIEAGLAMTASLGRVASEFTRSCPALASEFKLVNVEMLAGKTTSEALRGLSDRTGVQEISSLVAMLIQTERFGTSIADALRLHTEFMRTQRLQKAEEKAEKAAVKMVLPSALFIFPATIIIAIGPGMVEMSAMFGELGG